MCKQEYADPKAAPMRKHIERCTNAGYQRPIPDLPIIVPGTGDEYTPHPSNTFRESKDDSVNYQSLLLNLSVHISVCGTAYERLMDQLLFN